MEHKPAVELRGVELSTLSPPSEVLVPMTSDGQQREGFYQRLSSADPEYAGGLPLYTY
ncbi:MAG: hypothetical protein K0Q57_1255 [Gammaproteobacteria bacterium]|nr:hypothetical protein [Gammaproteobacteria bacterium]